MPASLFGAARRQHRLAAGLLAALSLGACTDILDVKNPNRIVEEALANPASATAQANGLGQSVTRALTAIYAPYSAATDELQYVGSRDAYDQLDKGFVAGSSNEFVDAAIPYVSEARFMADATVQRLEAFRNASPTQLTVPSDLIRTYLYAAIIYTSIPDVFDDFVIAPTDPAGRTTPHASVGHANLTVMYDSAIAFTTRALAMPEANLAANATLKAQALALRARARFSKGLYAKTVVGAWVAGPSVSALVADNGYVADATAALATLSGDWVLKLTPQAATNGFPVIGNDINNRLELRAGDLYIVPSASGGGKRVGSIRLKDPIDNVADPALTKAINACCVAAVSDFVPIVTVSAREMNLIIAESALQAGNTPSFAGAINNVRAFDGLTSWNALLPQVPALDLLMHERRVNLYLQGRRLRDMYRFGFKDPAWTSTPPSTAYAKSGCMLILTDAERIPNPSIAAPSCTS